MPKEDASTPWAAHSRHGRTEEAERPSPLALWERHQTGCRELRTYSRPQHREYRQQERTASRLLPPGRPSGRQSEKGIGCDEQHENLQAEEQEVPTQVDARILLKQGHPEYAELRDVDRHEENEEGLCDPYPCRPFAPDSEIRSPILHAGRFIFYRFIVSPLMERNRAADAFVNCVSHRSDRDTVIKPSLFGASIIVPILFGTLTALWILFSDTDYGRRFFSESDREACIMAAMIVAFAVEISLSSFMMYCVSRCNRNHLKRDEEWMAALCDYVDSHGGDSSEMRRISRGCSGPFGNIASKVSLFIWILTLVSLAATGIALHSVSADHIAGAASGLAVLMVPTILLLMLQFLITVGSVLGFPARHDKMQADFTGAMCKEFDRFGFCAEPFSHDIPSNRIWVHALLMLLSLGLYSFIYLFISCKEMNSHLVGQWVYEEDLMRRMIDFEGGIGIEAVTTERKLIHSRRGKSQSQ